MSEKRPLEDTFFKELFKRYFDDDLPALAAELAYFFLLSMFPFLIFLVTLLAYLPVKAHDLLALIENYAPEGTLSLIESNLEVIMNGQKGKVLSFSVIGSIWTASVGINAVVRAFNRAYDVKETRSFIVAKGMSILLTIAMVFVIIVALLLPVFGWEIGMFIFSHFGLSETFLTVWNAVRWIISTCILYFVFTSLYFFAPNKRLKIREVAPGSLVATIGWIVVSIGFSYYVSKFGNYAATYGGLGGIIVLLVWFYLSAMILVLGGEINGIIRCRKDAKHC